MHFVIQIVKTTSVQGHDNTDKYRQLLVKHLHACAIKFPDTAATIIPVVSLLSIDPMMSSVLFLLKWLHLLLSFNMMGWWASLVF